MRNEAVIPIAQFLGRAWSGKPQLYVRLDSSAPPYAQVSTQGDSIIIPPPSRFPTTGLVAAYRLWRASLWHEAMHHYYGIPKLEQRYTKLAEVLNIVEDYRIEELGVREYPGMKRELDLRRAVYYHLAGEPYSEIEAYAQLLLLGAAKGGVTSRVVEAVRYTKEAIAQGVDSITVARKVCEILSVRPEQYHIPRVNVIQYTVPQEKRIKTSKLKEIVEGWLSLSKNQPIQTDLKHQEQPTTQAQERQLVSLKSIEDEAEEILAVPSEIEEELSQIKNEDRRIEYSRKGAASEVAEGVMLPSKLDVDESKFYDQELITHLVSQLRSLRKKYKEVTSTTGEFDVDSYVSRHSKVFIDEEPLKIGGFKVLLIVDHSGSIAGYDKAYKTACIALAESLSTLNIPFAIYVFSEYSGYGCPPVTQIYMVKGFHERWTRMNAKRLAQISPAGGTPLYDVYLRLTPLIQKHKGRLYVITLTDGMPHGPESCKRLIMSMKQQCRMIAVAFGRDMDEAVRLAMNLRQLGYERYVALDDVKKLPEKVLGLLGM
jgi:hypothetical protein